MASEPTPLARRFRRDFLWNVASLAILGMSGIVLNTLLARYAGADALGVFNQVFAFYIFLSQLAVGGIHFSVLKHLSYRQDDPGAGVDVAASGLVLVATLASVVALLTFAARSLAGAALDSPGVAVGLGLVAPGLVAFALNKVLLNVLNGLNRMRAYAVFQALRYLLIVGAAAALLATSLPDAYLAGSLSIAEGVLLTLLAVYVDRRVLPLRGKGGDWGAWFREHLSFGARGFLSGALAEANTRIDVLVLGLFRADRIVGIYSFAAILAEGFGQLAIVVRRNFDPLLGESFARGDARRIERQARRVRRVFVPGMILLGVAAVALYPAAVALVVPDPDFGESFAAFAILMTGVVLNAGYRPFLGILPQGGRPGTYTLLVAAVVLANLAGNLLLIPRLGMAGAALATAAALVVESVLIAVLARRLFGVRL